MHLHENKIFYKIQINIYFECLFPCITSGSQGSTKRWVSKFRGTFQRAETQGKTICLRGYHLKHHRQHDLAPVWGFCFKWPQGELQKATSGSLVLSGFITCVISLWTLLTYWHCESPSHPRDCRVLLHLFSTSGKHGSVSLTLFSPHIPP